MRYLSITFCGVLVAFSLNQTQAKIIHVPADSSTIQGGINGATNGDTVLVQPDTYVENINFNTSINIVLGSLFLTSGDTSYISSTIIDGNSSGTVVTYGQHQNGTAIIAGFTIQNGSASQGGGIYCAFSSSPTIRNNIITGNSGGAFGGGGIYCSSNSSPTIDGNTISGNSADDDGGGIYCWSSNPTIVNNIISGNSAVNWGGGGIYCIFSSNPIIVNNIINGNSAQSGGCGIYCGSNSNPTIINNTIRGNSGGTYGGGIYCHNSNVTMSSNTISGNSAVGGGGMYCLSSTGSITNTIFWANSGSEVSTSFSSSLEITYCNIQGGRGGEGNIDSNPLFLDPHNLNYNVCSQSPCIDTGDPGMQDPDGTRSDIGVYYPEHLECFVGNDWHVSTAGNDNTGDGSSGNPFRTIQHAINVSLHGDSVIVQNGTYMENINFYGKEIQLTSNHMFSADTLDIQNTIIDGDSVATVVTFEFGEDSQTAITGFTIRNGCAPKGGGVSCDFSTPTMKNNIITHNSRSGVCCFMSSPTIDSNTIVENSTYGVFCQSSSDATISNNTISENSEIGIYCMSSDPTISHNGISENSGSGIKCSSHSDPLISNNTITKNSADSSDGGAIHCRWYSNPTIRNNTIDSNSAHGGGGIYCFDSSSPTITNNTISTNSATYSGGIACIHNSSPAISNNCITGNSAYDQGGGIYCFTNSNPTITNNTITGNSAGDQGGGIYCFDSSPIIKNTIFWADTAQNGPEVYPDSASSPVITYCDIQGGWPGEENIDADPLFRDPESGDFHLQNSIDCGDSLYSPCIDAGDPAILDILLDCDWGGLGTDRSDMGAYGGERIDSDVLEENILVTPSDFLLFQNYPNPFNQTTKIDFVLAKSGFVSLYIYDILGRKVRSLVSGHFSPGHKSVLWEGKNDAGKDIASGIYFYQMKVGEFTETKRLALLK